MRRCGLSVCGISSLVKAALTSINSNVQGELATAEMISLPITLVVFVFVFGGLVAAGVPVLGAITLPLLSMKTALTGIESVKQATPAVTVAHALNERFGDNTDPAV